MIAMSIEPISSLDLTLGDIPPDDVEIESLEMFALTFDGYDFWGSFEACAEQARFDCQCIDHLRTRLFFHQRAGRHGDGLQRNEAVPVLRALRSTLSATVPAECLHDCQDAAPPVLERRVKRFGNG